MCAGDLRQGTQIGVQGCQGSKHPKAAAAAHRPHLAVLIQVAILLLLSHSGSCRCSLRCHLALLRHKLGRRRRLHPVQRLMVPAPSAIEAASGSANADAEAEAIASLIAACAAHLGDGKGACRLLLRLLRRLRQRLAGALAEALAGTVIEAALWLPAGGRGCAAGKVKSRASRKAVGSWQGALH